MTIVLSTVAGLITAAILLVLGRAYETKLSRRLNRRRRALKALLPFHVRAGQPLVICYGYVPTSSTGTQYTVEQGDLMALMRANQVATALYTAKRVQYAPGSALYGALQLHANILTVSGPKWNPVTARLIGDLGSPVTFSSTEHAIVVADVDKTTVYRADRDEGQLATVCYGIILSGTIRRSGTSSLQHVLLCAGRTTLSTNACLLFLSLLEGSRDRMRFLRNAGVEPGKQWGVLLRVERKGVEVNWPLGPLQESDVNLEVVRFFPPSEFREAYTVDYRPRVGD
jgi:hypothetical protein